MQERPNIFSYSDIIVFANDMLLWKKHNDATFSLRSATADLRRCSPALVTLVLQGKRKLTPDRAKDFSKLLSLQPRERTFFEACVDKLGINNTSGETDTSTKEFKQNNIAKRRSTKPKTHANHLLSHWLHPYVKDVARLKGFAPNTDTIFKLLRGLASPKQIANSLGFLLREGYLRHTLDGRIIENEILEETTDEIPNQKIKDFHKKALLIAANAIDTYSVKQREADVMLLPLNKERFEHLKQLIKGWSEEVAAIAEAYPTDNECLYQVVINLSPIGISELELSPKENKL